MSDENVAIVRKSFDALNAHDADRFAALLDEGYVWETDTLPTPVRGPRAAGETMQMYWKAFPDSRYEIEGLHVAGDHVISRWRAIGTHRGELMGLPATNKKVDVHGCTVNELKNGKITRAWVYWDTGQMLRQLGVLPASGKGKSAS